MGWKELPAWIKGGIILGVLDIILVLYVIISSHPLDAQLLALGIVQFPSLFLFSWLGQNYTQNIYIISLGGILTWFLIGAIIGWIVGKIRNK